MSGFIVAGVAAIGLTGFAAAAAVVAIHVVLAVALSVALSFVSQALFKPPQRGNSGTGSTQTYTDNKVTVRQAAASAQIVYGLARVPGVIAYAKTTSGAVSQSTINSIAAGLGLTPPAASDMGGNKYLHLVILLAGHECSAFHTVTVNEEWFQIGLLDADGFVQRDGAGNLSQYAGKVRFKFHLGSPSQTADSQLILESVGDWTANDRLQGITYMYVRLEWDPKVFFGGIPNLTALVYGKKDIYDSRSGTTGYSGNAALIVANYLCDTQYGLGVDMNTGIDLAALSAAANTCDELVTLAAGGTEARYIANGVTTSSNQPQEILGQLLGAMHGRAPYNGETWRILAGAYQTPTISLTADDLRGGSLSVQTLTSRRDLFNAVKGTYFEPASLFQEVDFPPVVNTSYASDDGQTIYKDMQLPFSSTSGTCQRIAKIELTRTRIGMIVVTASFKLSAWRVQAGDTVSFTHARYGWSNKPFEVTRAQFGVDKSTGILGVDLTLIATDPSVYAWSSSEEGTISAGSTTTLPNPLSVLAPTSLVLSEVAQVTAPGTGVKSDMAVSWTASTDAFVSEYQVEYKKSTDSTFTVAGRTTGIAFQIHDLVPATWNVRVAAVNIKGVLSSYISGTLVTTGDLTAPSDPSGLSVSYSFTVGGASTVFLQWTPAAQEKVYSGGKVEIRFQAVTSGATWASAILVTTVPGREMTAVVPFSQSGTYLIKFLSASGIYSTNAASIVATYSAAYQPIKIVNSLPVSGEFTGQTDYLTTDGKLYRWTGAAWTASVSTTDLTGLITGGLIGPNTVTANNLTVGDFQNRVDNPDFNLGNVSWGTYSVAGGVVSFTATTPGHYTITAASGFNGSGDYLLVDVGATNSTPCANANLFPVQAGEVYYFAAAVNVQGILGNLPSQSCIIRLHFLDSSGATVAGTNNTLTWAAADFTGGYTTKAPASTSDVTVPATAINAYVEVLTGSATALANGTYRVGWIFCSKKNNGSVIVDGSITANLVAANAIVTNSIVAGAVTAAKAAITQLSALTADLGSVTAGTVTSALVRTASGGDRVQMDGSTGDVRVYVSGVKVAQLGGSIVTGLLEIVAPTPLWYPAYLENSSTIGGGASNGGGAAKFKSNGGWTIEIEGVDTGGSGLGTYAVNAGNVGTGGGRLLIGASSGSGGWAAYSVSGGYGPFTGAHDGLILKGTSVAPGDIVVDGTLLARKLSDCITEVHVSGAAGQAAIGVFVRSDPASAEDPPASMIADDGTTEPAWAGFTATHDLAVINSVGEGAINVCGQAGDLAAGDLIVVSDSAGKGMKQADDVVRVTTVARAREGVTFAGPTDVKQIACIYLCG